MNKISTEVEHFIEIARGIVSADEAAQHLKKWRTVSQSLSRSSGRNLTLLARTHTEYKIEWGLLLLELQKLVSLTGTHTWTAWAAEEFHFMDERDRQICMQLAKHPALHNNTDLKAYRMLNLITLHHETNLSFPKILQAVDPIKRKSKHEFKNHVDALAAFVGCYQEGIRGMKYGIIRNAIYAGVKFDDDMLKVLKKEKDVNQYLNTLHLSGGHKKLQSSSEKLHRGFGKIAQEMITTMKVLRERPETLSTVNQRILAEFDNEYSEFKKTLEVSHENISRCNGSECASTLQ